VGNQTQRQVPRPSLLIRQIEVRAFEKLQKAMQRIAGERLLPGVA